jgi:hypothetical protein
VGAVVERKTLYDQLWSVPGWRLCATYGISDVGLAKVCKRYQIPRPPRGYWARRAVGQKIKRPPLPKVPEHLRIVNIKGCSMAESPIDVDSSEVQKPIPASAGAPNHFNRPHPLSETTRQHLASAKPDHDGLLRSNPATAIDVRVSPDRLDRCISVISALFNRWEAMGGSIELGAKVDGVDGVTTAIVLGDDRLGMYFTEGVNEQKPLTDPTRLTGYINIFITGETRREFRRRWSDTKSQRVERMFNPLLETLTTTLTKMKTERLDAECVQRQKKKSQARRKVIATDDSREFYWQQELLEKVDRWHNARRIREYLSALKAAIEGGHQRVANPEGFEAWISWAARFADRIDPLINAPREKPTVSAPENTPADKLDMTARARKLIAQLGVADSDALWRIKESEIEAACAGRYGAIWNEITRVLDGLGYDVAKRRDAYEWQ